MSKCYLKELKCFEIGEGKNKKQAKCESAKKVIEMIAHIPDVQSTIISILMSDNLNDTVLSGNKYNKGKKYTPDLEPPLNLHITNSENQFEERKS